MTPTDFRERYKDLTVNTEIPDGKTASFSGLHVDKYAMYSGFDGEPQQKIEAVRSAVVQFNKVQGAGSGLPLDEDAFKYARFYRGRPDHLEHILAMGLATGHLQPDVAVLQKFVDDCFRTDCVGFVSSYFRFERGRSYFTDNEVLNHGCGPFYDKAKAQGEFVWNPESIRQGDVILWMCEDREETRKPGHIALIQWSLESALAGNVYTLACEESNGAKPSGDPRRTKRFLKHDNGKPEGPAGKRYWNLEDGSKVIVVRLP